MVSILKNSGDRNSIVDKIKCVLVILESLINKN